MGQGETKEGCFWERESTLVLPWESLDETSEFFGAWRRNSKARRNGGTRAEMTGRE